MARGRGGGDISIGPQEVGERIAGPHPPLVLDVREPPELLGRGAAIAGAINIPLAELRSRLGEISQHRDREVVTVCNTGTAEGRAAAAARLLTAAGFPRARRLDGGIIAWVAMHRGPGKQSRRRSKPSGRTSRRRGSR